MRASEVEALTLSALRELGVRASVGSDRPDLGWDLCLEPGGVRLQLKYRSLVDGSAARSMVAEAPASSPIVLAVGDRVTKEAREVLVDHGAGYFDLRGRLALRTEALVINAEVEPSRSRPERSDALAGKSGLEVATALLLEPIAGHGVRELAREIGRSPSTVSEIIGLLKRDGLIDKGLRVSDAQLFWRVADVWSTPRTHLAALPPREASSAIQAPLRLGLDMADSAGWALTDSVAAVAYGAPLALRRDQVSDFFVPDGSSLQRAVRLLGLASSPVDAAASVRVAPVPAACGRRVVLDASGLARWPLAHPLFVALDLAQDAGRGRDVLDAWTPEPRWPRVW